MKTVFTNAEVCHVWASQKQATGKSGHIFFEGDTIYSYGHHFPMAKIIGENVLVTNKRYSVTTAKHMSALYRAISHKNIINVYDPLNQDISSNIVTLCQDIEENRQKALRAIKWGSSLVDTIKSQQDNLIKYVNVIPKKSISAENKKRIAKSLGELFTPDQLKEMEEKRKRAEIADAERHKKRMEMWRIQQEEREKEQAENRQKWINGEDVYYNSSYGAIALRVKDNEIQTSAGASIPVSIALRLWKRLQAKEGIQGMSLGHYTVDQFDGKTLQAGCHKIDISEIERMADVLGLRTVVTV